MAPQGYWAIPIEPSSFPPDSGAMDTENHAENHPPLMRAITDRHDDLIALTQDLIRIPTLNPPGDNYREICEYLDKRLQRSGFQTELIRAHGTPGDSDKYPRWNIVARRDGTATGDCVHFNSHIDVVEVGHGWTRTHSEES